MSIIKLSCGDKTIDEKPEVKKWMREIEKKISETKVVAEYRYCGEVETIEDTFEGHFVRQYQYLAIYGHFEFKYLL